MFLYTHKVDLFWTYDIIYGGYRINVMFPHKWMTQIYRIWNLSQQACAYEIILMTMLWSEQVCPINKNFFPGLGVCHGSEVTCSHLLLGGWGFDTWWSGSGTRIIVGRCGWCSSDCESTCLPWNGWGDHEWNYWIAGMKQRHPEMCPPFVLFWTKRLTALQTQFELILLLRYKFFW